MRVSDSDLMVINQTDFECLLGSSCGVPANTVRIMARPLMEKDREILVDTQDDPVPLHVEILSPVVLTVPPPPTLRAEESLL